jgi:NAD-dependent SIR2 family protein deacetylase
MKISILPEKMDTLCVPCNKLLEPAHVELEYLGNVFNVEMPVCPSCSAVLIPEEVALGKMLEVEKLLEDK